MKNTKMPKSMIVLAIITGVAGIAGIVLMVLGFALLDATPAMIIPGFLLVGTAMTAMTFLLVPILKKFGIKAEKYIQETNREDLEDIATTNAEIGAEATTITAKAMAQGLKEGFKDTKFCKHCGAEIDRDSKFCSECGGAQ